MTLEIYSIPNYYINKNIVLTYQGISDLLSDPYRTITDVNQIDINNVVINFNYYNFISLGLNYVRINSIYCYFISSISMCNNGNIKLTLEIDATHTLEFIKESNILDLVGASYVKRGLSSKSKNYNKVINTFTFDSDTINTSKSYLLAGINLNESIDVLNYEFTELTANKCLYLIVNENWTPLTYDTTTAGVNYYCYDDVNEIYSLINQPTKEKGINTNKYFLVIPLCSGFVSTGNFKAYQDDTLINPVNYHVGANSDDFDLYLYLSELVKYDPTNIIEYGLCYLPLGNLNYKPVVLPNINVVSGACPMLQIVNFNNIDLEFDYSKFYNNAYTNIYIREGLDLKEVVTPQVIDTIDVTLYYSIASNFEIKIKVNNLLNEKGFEVYNITDTTKSNIPVYIDGVERQALLNNAMIANQQRQQERLYNLSKDMELLNYIDTSIGLGSKTASSVSKGELISGGVGLVGGVFGGIVKNINSISTREINHDAQAEAIRIRKNNLKYATSSFSSGQNILLGNDIISAPYLYYVNYNNDYNKKLYNLNGVEVARVVDNSILTSLTNTYIMIDLNFNIELNYNLASEVKDLFNGGVYIFDSDAEALEFVNTGSGLTDFEL